MQGAVQAQQLSNLLTVLGSPSLKLYFLASAGAA
jgi:hypothetical protein